MGGEERKTLQQRLAEFSTEQEREKQIAQRGRNQREQELQQKAADLERRRKELSPQINHELNLALKAIQQKWHAMDLMQEISQAIKAERAVFLSGGWDVVKDVLNVREFVGSNHPSLHRPNSSSIDWLTPEQELASLQSHRGSCSLHIRSGKWMWQPNKKSFWDVTPKKEAKWTILQLSFSDNYNQLKVQGSSYETYRNFPGGTNHYDHSTYDDPTIYIAELIKTGQCESFEPLYIEQVIPETPYRDDSPGASL